MASTTLHRTVITTSAVSTSVTAVQSLALTKNLMRVGLSQIAYARSLFPEHCFTDKSYIDMKIKHLQPKSDAGGIRNEEAHLLTNWLEQGVFDALTKRYLRAVVFAISVPVGGIEEEDGREEGPEKVVETYQWKVGYTEEGEVVLNASRIAKTKAELKGQAISLIRALLMFTQTLESLPSHRTLSLKLLYYDDRTPISYEPPFFQAAARGDCLSVEEEGCLKVKIGSVTSPQYALELKFVGVDPSVVLGRREEGEEEEKGGLLVMQREDEEDEKEEEEETDEEREGGVPPETPETEGGREKEEEEEDDDVTMADEEDEEETEPRGRKGGAGEGKKENKKKTYSRGGAWGGGEGVAAAMTSLSLQDKTTRKEGRGQGAAATAAAVVAVGTKKAVGPLPIPVQKSVLHPPSAIAAGAAGAAAAGAAATASLMSASSFLPMRGKIVVGSVAYADLEAVRAHIVSFYRPGSMISIHRVAAALGMSKEGVEAAFVRLAEEEGREGGREGGWPFLENRSWGSGSRFVVRLNKEEEGKKGRKEGKGTVAAGGGGLEGGSNGEGGGRREDRTPMEMQRDDDDDETRDGYGENEEEVAEPREGGTGSFPYSQPHPSYRPPVAAQQHAPPKAPRPGRGRALPPPSHPSAAASSSSSSSFRPSLLTNPRRGATRLASEYLLESGEDGFEISLTQEESSARCKASVVSRPIVQRAKRTRR